MHEIGHNIWLLHSNGKDRPSYGDQLCMIGLFSTELDSLYKCFNAAKSQQLSWYNDKLAVLDIESISEERIRLAAILYYSEIDNYSLVKIVNYANGFVYYVAFHTNYRITYELDRHNSLDIIKQSLSLLYEDSLLATRLFDNDNGFEMNR